MTPAPHCSDAEHAPRKPIGHKPHRLTKRAEFLRVASKGRRVGVHGLVLQGLERGDAGLMRLGFTVTKKIGNAVVRNRTRRRLKEAARLHFAAFPAGDVDLVLIGRSSTRDRHFEDLKDDIRRALSKLSLSRSQAP